MYWTNHAEKLILNTFLGQSATAPTKVYAGAFIGAPDDTGGGSEISYPGYERVTATFSVPADEGLGTHILVDTDINFPESNQSAGTITHFAFFDSKVAGNMISYMKVEGDTITVDNGVAPQIKAGKLKFETRGNFSKVFKARTLNLLRGVNIDGFSPAMALYDGNPEDGGNELSGDNYARFAVKFGAPSEQATGHMKISNSEKASSNVASSNWGTLRYYAVMDALTAGTCVAYLERGAEQVMGETRTVTLNKPGDFSILVS